MNKNQKQVYRVLSPADVWNGYPDLIGKLMRRWVGWTADWEADQSPYRSSAKILADVKIGPHAYTLVYAGGSTDSLTSYDSVTVWDGEPS